MTVSSTENRESYAGNGSTTAFAFPNKFLLDADLKVELVVDATGVSTMQVLTTDYTLAGAGLDAGGTVTMLTPPASGETLVVYRDPALIQPTDYVENDPFPAATHETALDRLTLFTQRLMDLAVRSFRLADADDSGASTDVPSPEANKVLAWNAAGDALENIGVSNLAGYTVTQLNTPSSVVQRDALGDFAAGEITAETGFVGDVTGDVTGNITGNLTGNVTGDLTGDVTGNADTADSATLAATVTPPSAAQVIAGVENTLGLTAAAFVSAGQSLATPGYVTLPGGFILQWGIQNMTDNDEDNVTLPIAYPTAHVAAWANPTDLVKQGIANWLLAAANPVNLTTVRVQYNGSATDTQDIQWFSIGY